MTTSKITGKSYNPSECVFISNPTQCAKYCKFLGTDLLMDIILSSERREDALIFVWKKCPETREAKQKWDNHEL
jgi:hypothetical protein